MRLKIIILVLQNCKISIENFGRQTGSYYLQQNLLSSVTIKNY